MNNVSTPSVEDIDKDLNQILKMLEELDTSNLSIDANIDKISKDINNQLGGISKKYEPLIDDLENKNKISGEY
tara:strand:- start:292 stop:510 length:219 start_codon:yes stop_codon:yes gene_type:complete